MIGDNLLIDIPGVQGPFDHPHVDVIFLPFQGMMGSLNWPQEEWKANMEEVDLMMFLMDVKIKNKHTSKREDAFLL